MPTRVALLFAIALVLAVSPASRAHLRQTASPRLAQTSAQTPSSTATVAPPPAPQPATGTIRSTQRHPEEGLPFVRIYRPAEVAADGQNWAMVQDKRGLIYVGSAAGVAEYDGVSWRLIETAGLTTVRSLAIDDAGIIYVGSVGDLGYLASDGSGELRYVSLVDQVPADVRDFADIWRTLRHAAGRALPERARDLPLARRRAQRRRSSDVRASTGRL